METDWLLAEIATGLQKLACLSLDRTPSFEIIEGTAMAWLEAITDGRVWDATRDAPRIRAAFRVLARTCTHWPSPRLFLESVPAVERPVGLPKPAPDPDRAAREIETVRRLLDPRMAAAGGDR